MKINCRQIGNPVFVIYRQASKAAANSIQSHAEPLSTNPDAASNGSAASQAKSLTPALACVCQVSLSRDPKLIASTHGKQHACMLNRCGKADSCYLLYESPEMPAYLILSSGWDGVNHAGPRLAYVSVPSKLLGEFVSEEGMKMGGLSNGGLGCTMWEIEYDGR